MESVARIRFPSSQSGQIILIILLVMVVGLTIGLAVIARSVTSVKISTQEEESQKAFYAAEAGLEEALSGSAATIGTVGTASYTITVPASSPGRFDFPDKVKKDDTQSVWLVGHDADGNILPPGSDDQRYNINNNPIDICWNRTGEGSEPPAMEVIIIWQNTTGQKQYGLARGAYDPNSERTSNNKFASAGGSNCSTVGYSSGQRITFYPGGFNINPNNRRVVALRLRPIYYDANLSIRTTANGSYPGPDLPSQGQEIESLGTAGTVQRKLKVTRSYPALPPIFDFAVFSGQDLVKNP